MWLDDVAHFKAPGRNFVDYINRTTGKKLTKNPQLGRPTSSETIERLISDLQNKICITTATKTN